MAFRRRRTFRRRGLKRSASAFAPAKSGGGHLDWEAAGSTCWSHPEQVMPLENIVYGVTCDGAQVDYQTRAMILIPLNEARGTVTLLRVRGYLAMRNNVGGEGFAVPASARNSTLHWMLQLVPRDPDLVTTPQGSQLLSGNKAPDQESNRIIMQWVSVPDQYAHFATPETELQFMWGREIDVKTKRRFLRAQWALCLSITAPVAAFDELNRIYANLRMLFRADDGI